LWAILLIASVAGTFTLYEIVRRVGALRFLFGMKARSRVARPRELEGPHEQACRCQSLASIGVVFSS